jgi:hypothetical protein
MNVPTISRRVTNSSPDRRGRRPEEVSVTYKLFVAERSAVDIIAYLHSVRAWAKPQAFSLINSLPWLVEFWERFSPLRDDDLRIGLSMALPYLRGVRPRTGIRLLGHRVPCAAELLLTLTRELHDSLGDDESFEQIEFVLLNKFLRLSDANPVNWQLAVKHYLFIDLQGVSRARLPLTNREGKPLVFKPIYDALHNEPAFRTAVESHPLSNYDSLAKELGRQVATLDLEELLRQVKWEVSRAILTSHRPDPKDEHVGPPPPRITADRDTQCVILDGHRYTVADPIAFKLWAALIDAHHKEATPISKKKLFRAARRLDSDPRIDRMKNGSAPKLSKLIQVKDGRGGGVSLKLPRSRKKVIPV